MQTTYTPREAVAILFRTYKRARGGLTHESAVLKAARDHAVPVERARVLIEAEIAREAEEAAVASTPEGAAGVVPDTFPEAWV